MHQQDKVGGGGGGSVTMDVACQTHLEEMT